MSTSKPLARKIRLLKAGRQNSRVPHWVMLRTNRKVVRQPKRRTWFRGRAKR